MMKKTIAFIVIALAIGLFGFAIGRINTKSDDNQVQVRETVTASVTQAPAAATPPKSTETTKSKIEETTYILNKNTKKFHYPWCSSVSQMKESNKKEYKGSRYDVIESGYAPCQKCNP